MNRVPHEALDGVGTFWALDRSAVSLFSYRFRGYRERGPRVHAADQSLRLLPRRSRRGARAAGQRGLAQRRAAGSGQRGSGTARLCPYDDDGTKLAVHVLAFSNTVSWQFRYEPVPGTYTPLTAQTSDGLVGGSDALRAGPASIACPALADLAARPNQKSSDCTASFDAVEVLSRSGIGPAKTAAFIPASTSRLGAITCDRRDRSEARSAPAGLPTRQPRPRSADRWPGLPRHRRRDPSW